MNKTEKEAIDVLAQTINSACQRNVEQAEFDKTVPATVIGINKRKFVVEMMGAQYEVTNSGLDNVNIGSSVWVTIPCNVLKNAYISSTRNGNGEFFSPQKLIKLTSLTANTSYNLSESIYSFSRLHVVCIISNNSSSASTAAKWKYVIDLFPTIDGGIDLSSSQNNGIRINEYQSSSVYCRLSFQVDGKELYIGQYANDQAGVLSFEIYGIR